jgi:acylphosphatase
MTVVRCRVVVRGRVQGVWFRESCRRQAVAAGLAGSVRNRDDGRVEAEFEGERDAVDGLIEWCRRGPSQARVMGLEVFDEPPVGQTGFHVY